MRTKAVMASCTLLAIACTSIAEDLRTWTSRKGSTVSARYTRLDGNQVILQRADDSFVTIDQTDLSPADQRYIHAGNNRTLSPRAPNQNQKAASVTQPVRLPPRAILVDEDTDDEPWGEPRQGNPGLRVPAHLGKDGDANAWLQKNQINQQAIGGGRQQRQMPRADLGEDQHSLGTSPLYSSGRTATDDWATRQKQIDDLAAQRKQLEREREADRLKSMAFQLEGRISGARNKSDPDYKGMAFDAESLARDSSRLGNRSASWHFDNAAADLKKLDRDQNDSSRSSSSFGSDIDSKRRGAETDVWSGRGSLNRFDTKSTDSGW